MLKVMQGKARDDHSHPGISSCILFLRPFARLITECAGLPTSANFTHAKTFFMKRKILIIEDNQEIRENTAEILELAGYEPISAANGRMGVDMALSQKPSLIVCDI